MDPLAAFSFIDKVMSISRTPSLFPSPHLGGDGSQKESTWSKRSHASEAGARRKLTRGLDGGLDVEHETGMIPMTRRGLALGVAMREEG